MTRDQNNEQSRSQVEIGETIRSRSETRLTLTSFTEDVLKSETKCYSLPVATLSTNNAKFEVSDYEDDVSLWCIKCRCTLPHERSGYGQELRA